MIDCIYNRFSISLNDNNKRYFCNHVINIDEYDSEITFETYVPIDGIKRGWVGDLHYHIGGYPFDSKNKSEVTSVTSLKDVLCARITITADQGEAVVWKYTFLKD